MKIIAKPNPNSKEKYNEYYTFIDLFVENEMWTTVFIDFFCGMGDNNVYGRLRSGETVEFSLIEIEGIGIQEW